jgi:hypothetical protein
MQTILTLSFVGMFLMAAPSRAQEDDLQTQLDRMEAVIVQQQTELEQQRQQLTEQYELIKKLQARQEAAAEADQPGQQLAAESAPEPESKKTAEVEKQAAGKSVAEVSGGQKAAEAEFARRELDPDSDTTEKEAITATLYDPSNTIYDENFPGAWHLPGTTAAMKVGGFINTSVVTSFDPMLISDRFITGSIPPDGTDVPGARSGTEVTASQTRFNVEVREQTSRGQLRAFLEGDFEGGDDTFRLRHAFGQYRSMLAGKTWSTFMDVDARPEEVDFEGINGEVLARQTQIRFFPSVGRDYRLKVSLEDPDTDIENGTGSRGAPDLVASVARLPLGELGSFNYRLAFVLRNLEGTEVDEDNFDPDDPTQTRNATGWGISTSGRSDLTRLGEGNALLWQLTYGKGVGRYLNDLNTIGGGDAVFDPDGDLRPLEVFGGYVSYRHHWPMRWRWMQDWPGILRSNLTASVVWIDNFDFQEDKDYHSTVRISGNLLYFPTSNVRIGAELLWGRRENKDKTKGDATQLQLSARYNF